MNRIYIIMVCLFFSHMTFSQTATLSFNDPGCILAASAKQCTTPVTWSATNAPNAGVFIDNNPNYWTGTQGTKNFPWTEVIPQTLYVRLNKLDSSSQILAQKQIYAHQAATPSATLSFDTPGCYLGTASDSCTTPITWSATNAPNAGVFIDNNPNYWTGTQGTKNFIWTTVTPSTLYVRLNKLDSSSQILAQKQVYATTDPEPYSLLPGGSNFNWYSHGVPPTDGSDPIRSLFPYGIIKNYHTGSVRSTVQNLLQDMYQNGQRRLRVSFFHTRFPIDPGASGTQIYSSRKQDKQGNYYHISPTYLNNLKNYLIDIKNSNFDEVLISMKPLGCNAPSTWRRNYDLCQQDIQATFDGDQLKPGVVGNEGLIPLWTENWRVVEEVLNYVNQSGINYKIDFGNERIPPANVNAWAGCELTSSPNPCDTTMPSIEIPLYQARWENYLRVVWENYVSQYGNVNTVGYSFSISNVGQVYSKASVLDKVYGNTMPTYMDFHIYDRGDNGTTCNNSSKSVYCKYTAIANTFTNLSGLILGEVFYNDAETAIELKAAINETGVTPYYLLQWPIARAPVYYSHPVPMIYDNYSSRGF